MRETIKYIDDNDRSYGLTGMAISMVVLDNGEKLVDINIDRSPEPLGLSHDFFFSGHQHFSARRVWSEIAENFHLAIAMAMGNLLSRKMILKRDIFDETDERDLYNLAVREGADICGLDSDEVEKIWNKDYNYLRRVFAHPTIQKVAKELADEICRRRFISRQEINDILSQLM